MVNFLEDYNKRLAKRIEELKTLEERNVAILALSFVVFKRVISDTKVESMNDPYYLSKISDAAYAINELVVIDINIFKDYSNKLLAMSLFKFENNVDNATCADDLFGRDIIFGNSFMDIWNKNFDLFKDVADKFYLSQIFKDHICLKLQNN